MDQQRALAAEYRAELRALGAEIPAPAGEAGWAPDLEALEAYLGTLLEQCRSAETRPYRRLSDRHGAPTGLSLLDGEACAGVYVPLRYDLHLSRVDVSRPGEGEMERPDPSRLDVELRQVLATPGHLVFIGAAGSGKTTILRMAAAALATRDAALIEARLGVTGPSFPVPVLVALRDFENACLKEPAIYRRDVESLLRFLDDHWARWHPGCVPHGFLGDLVRAGRAWLLLDALDEVADFDHRIAVRQTIERLAGTVEGTRLVVTARVAAYAAANTRLNARFHVATLRDLTRAQWKPMVERLYAGFETHADVAARRARLLVERIDGAAALQEMVKTPLMVWTAALIHYADRKLPEQRAELYDDYVHVLLGERLHEAESAEPAQRLRDARWPMEDRRLYLTYAAYQAHQGAVAEGGGGDRARGVVVVDEHDLVRRILAPFMAEYLGLTAREARQEAQDFLALMVERSGLLYAHEGGYSFGDHLTVQEFLAANYLVDNVRGTPDWTSFLCARAGQSWWREVMMLVAGSLVQWPQQARRFLLDELGGLPEAQAEARAYGLAWAGRALLEIPERRVGWHANARSKLARRLVGVLWQRPPQTTVGARIEAGAVLGRLGDPRFGGPCALPEFIPLPGGAFWMGSGEQEVARLVEETGKDWFERELPRHRVAVSPFSLSKYPTTNAMYALFVEAGGYAEARWWAEAIADGCWKEGKIQDWLGAERDRPYYWEDEGLNGANQPVVGVTWYEAAAYCRWLTAALDDGARYRLPTEAEWAYAARGAEGRAYPWGDGWQAERANTEELGLKRTTPVGAFPDGGTPEGVLDMAGNAWAWCQDWFDEETYRRRAAGGQIALDPAGPKEGRYRVLRGGSARDDRTRVRCAFRVRFDPGDWVNNIGFRVARGAP